MDSINPHYDNTPSQDLPPTQATFPTQPMLILPSPPSQANGQPPPRAQTGPIPAATDSSSIRNRVSEDQRRLQADSQGLFQESIGEGWHPLPDGTASTTAGGTAGWSFSDGDDVNIPESTLPADAGHSQVAVESFPGTKRRQDFFPQRGGHHLGVRLRYQQYHPYNQDESTLPSVAQPLPTEPLVGSNAAAAAQVEERNTLLEAGVGGMPPPQTAQVPQNGGVPAAVPLHQQPGVVPREVPPTTMPQQAPAMHAMHGLPTPQNGTNFPPGSSAAHRVLSPEEKQLVESKKKAALARRAEIENNRRKTARTLFFGAEGNPNNSQNYQQTQQAAMPTQQQSTQHAQQQGPHIPHAMPAGGPPSQHAQQAPQEMPAMQQPTPSQVQRAEENRQKALAKRREKLMEQAVTMSHAIITSPGGVVAENVLSWKQKIQGDIRKVIIAARHPPLTGVVPSPLTSPSPSPAGLAHTVIGAGPLGSGSSSQPPPLTPEQRQRAEANRQRALHRQEQRVEEDVAAFMNAAMQHARNIAASTGAGAGGGASQHQQQQQPWQAFL